MATSWFLVPIVGDGKSPDTAFAATLTSEVNSHVAVIGVSATTGAPNFTWCLLQATGTSFTNLLATAGVFQMPTPSGGLFSSLSASDQQNVNTALSHYSISIAPNATETLAHLITRLGQLQEPAFDLASFLVSPNAIPLS